MKCKKILTALLAAACTMSGCHGDLDIMQDNKLSASNMWIDESDAETATYGIYLYMRDALKSVHDIYLCWGEFRNGLWGGARTKRCRAWTRRRCAPAPCLRATPMPTGASCIRPSIRPT